MNLYIDKCIAKYKELFSSDGISKVITKINTDNSKEIEKPDNDNSKEIGNDNVNETVLLKEKFDEFERFFFIEMSNSLFSGEYLRDDYVNKVEDFENNLLTNENSFFASVRECLKELRAVLFNIYNTTEPDNKDIHLALWKNNAVNIVREDKHTYLDKWRFLSCNLMYIDHTLVNEKEYRVNLIQLYYEIQESSKGLDNNDLQTIYKKLKSKCSFLLRKTFVYDDSEDYYYSVDSEIKKINEILKGDDFNKDFSSLFGEMYPCKYGKDIVYLYQRNFSRKAFSSVGFVILAYYYRTSEKKSIQRLDNLLKDFTEYEQQFNGKNINKFDIYAIKSIKGFISNCRFSMLLKQKRYSLENLKDDFIWIESVQEETGIKNYHPYKKALSFLGNYLEKLKDDTNITLQEGLNLYRDIFGKYKIIYEECISHNFTPFQLTIEDCKTKGGIFIASSLSKPISPSKLREDEQDFRDIRQYLKIKERLSKREEEINNIANKIKDFRKESFEYLGIFITIITFLFGSIQLFGDNEIKLKASITNIVSLGIVLGIFMAMLYIVLYCKQNRIWLLFLFIILSLLAFILFNIYIK